MTPEFSRPVRLDTIGAQLRAMRIEADEAERAALARRFGLIALDRLEAELSVVLAADDVIANGRVTAEAVQACIVTGAPVPARIDDTFALRFRPESGDGGEVEVELAEDELDTIFFQGAAIDVGEAIAQTLALALDPYPRADGATLGESGVKSDGEAGPFGGLAALRDRLRK